MPYDEEELGWIQRKKTVERELRAMDRRYVAGCFGGVFLTHNEYTLVLERMKCSLQDVISMFSLISLKTQMHRRCKRQTSLIHSVQRRELVSARHRRIALFALRNARVPSRREARQYAAVRWRSQTKRLRYRCHNVL